MKLFIQEKKTKNEDKTTWILEFCQASPDELCHYDKGTKEDISSQRRTKPIKDSTAKGSMKTQITN